MNDRFNLTPQGFLIKVSGNPEKINLFDQKLLRYESQIKVMDPDYAYSIALAKIKVVMDEVQRPISCQAGCSACCHQKVDIVPLEGARIQQYISENHIEFDAKALETQTEALKMGAFEQLPFEQRQCVFLGSDQRCRIYSVRPLMCRRHFVVSDPAYCRTEEFSRIEMDVNPDADAYLSAYVTTQGTTALPAFIQSLKTVD